MAGSSYVYACKLYAFIFFFLQLSHDCSYRVRTFLNKRTNDTETRFQIFYHPICPLGCETAAKARPAQNGLLFPNYTFHTVPAFPHTTNNRCPSKSISGHRAITPLYPLFDSEAFHPNTDRRTPQSSDSDRSAEYMQLRDIRPVLEPLRILQNTLFRIRQMVERPHIQNRIELFIRKAAHIHRIQHFRFHSI